MSSLFSGAVESVSAAADAKAAAIYEQNKPLIYAVAFMVATTYLFFFLPRFELPKP